MQYTATLRVNVSGKHNLEQLKDRLQEIVCLDLDIEESSPVQVTAIEIDWETLECQKKSKTQT